MPKKSEIAGIYCINGKEVRKGDRLAPRELEAVRHVADCKPNWWIAARMGLTYGSLKQYLFIAYRKLGVNDRTQLAVQWFGLDGDRALKDRYDGTTERTEERT